MTKKEQEALHAKQVMEGSKGGTITYRRYGSAFFSKIAKDAWKRRKAKAKKKKVVS